MSTKRQALGRGLAALIPAAAPPPPPPAPQTTPPPTTGAAPTHTPPAAPSAAGRPEERGREGLREVAIEDVHPTRQQPRKTFDDDKLDELAASIRAQGLIQPLVVRVREAGGYEIIAGERRWRAAQRAGLHALPVVVRDVAPARAFELAMVENLQRQDLNPIEEAEGFDRLIREFGYTQESLATRVGKDRTTVTNALRLLKLPANVRALVIAGRLSMGHARAILGLEALGAAGGEAMERLARHVANRELSVRQVEELVRRERESAQAPASTAAAPTAPARPTASARDLSNRLSLRLKTRVRVIESGPGRGRIEIHFASLDQLDGLLPTLLG